MHRVLTEENAIFLSDIAPDQSAHIFLTAHFHSRIALQTLKKNFSFNTVFFIALQPAGTSTNRRVGINVSLAKLQISSTALIVRTMSWNYWSRYSYYVMVITIAGRPVLARCKYDRHNDLE